jgi:hypothetical protein
MSLGPPVPMYVMPCSCGLVWYTTRSESAPGGEHCAEVSKLFGRRTGCGRKLPAPVPEERCE